MILLRLDLIDLRRDPGGSKNSDRCKGGVIICTARGVGARDRWERGDFNFAQDFDVESASRTSLVVNC